MNSRSPNYPSTSEIILRVVINIVLFSLLCTAIALYSSADRSLFAAQPLFNISAGISAMGMTFMLCLIFAMDRGPRDRSTTLFFTMIILTFLGIMGDNVSWLLEADPNDRIWNHICAVISFLVSPVMMPVFWHYQSYLYPAERKHWKGTVTFVLFLTALDVVVILLGAVSGQLYTITEANKYISGPMEWVTTIFPGLMLLFCLIDNLRRDIPTRKRISLLVFTMLPMLGAAINLMYTDYSFLYIAVALAMLFLYGTIQMERSIEVARQAQALAVKQNQLTVAQIQPKFLEDSLKSIYDLCDRDVAKAQQTIATFSGYLRANMESLQSAEPIPFRKELEHAEAYLQIEKIRLGDRLTVVYDITCTDFELPPLSLQPLLEHAVNNSIGLLKTGGTLTIATRRDGSAALVSVTDDGVGTNFNALLQDDQLRMEFENGQARLARMNGSSILLSTDPIVGTTVTLRLENQF